jgi:hypothetical protein
VTDTILSTSGGSAALGRNPDTIYLGTGHPFDPVGGSVYRSTNGGNTWANAHQARRLDDHSRPEGRHQRRG